MTNNSGGRDEGISTVGPFELAYLDLFDYLDQPHLDQGVSHSAPDVDHANDTSEQAAANTDISGRPDVWYWRVGLFAAGGSGICCAGVISNIIAIVVLLNFR